MTFADEEIKSLIYSKQETPNQDYKESLIWGKNNKDACLEIIKDILSMANIKDGGRIIFGVRNSDLEYIGVSEASWNSFDVTPINQLLHQYADPVFTCSIVKRVIDDKKVIVIDVPEFIEAPIVCKSSAFSSQNKEILRKGTIYIRTAKCTSEAISSVEEMRSILGRSITKKSDELLQSIQRLMSGKPLIPPQTVQDIYREEIKEALVFLDTLLKEAYGYWQIIVYPPFYNASLISNQTEAGKIIESSRVLLRGWDFPHLDTHGNTTNFNRGRQSYVKWERYFEGWRLYKSGLFVWKRYFWEDIEETKGENNRPVLSFISAIYSITEFILFIKRLYSENLKVDSVHLQLTLSKCSGRQLVSLEPAVNLRTYIGGEDTIVIENDIKAVDLQASFKDVAKGMIKQVFMLFNWDDPSDKMIEDWQKKLIEKGGL